MFCFVTSLAIKLLCSQEAKTLLREGAFPDDDGEVYESDEDTTVQKPVPVHTITGHYDPLEEYVNYLSSPCNTVLI